MTCHHASGCNYPEGDCLGTCLVKPPHATRHTIKVDALRSVVIEIVGGQVNLTMCMSGLAVFSQPVKADIARVIGSALVMAGQQAAT